MEPTVWEYIILRMDAKGECRDVDINDGDADEFMDVNDIASDGWELYQVFGWREDKGFVVFRRPKMRKGKTIAQLLDKRDEGLVNSVIGAIKQSKHEQSSDQITDEKSDPQLNEDAEQ